MGQAKLMVPLKSLYSKLAIVPFIHTPLVKAIP